ncbi:MAG: hypothetical protein JW884_02680 [Deltaproteobacteria bacterium]|nr:hypothetical protein [Deltaproteobacteria bacterium]
MNRKAGIGGDAGFSVLPAIRIRGKSGTVEKTRLSRHRSVFYEEEQ